MTEVIEWTNGPIARVVVERAYPGACWSVSLQNASGAVLRLPGGERELSMPHPGRRGATEREARRLAKAHGVPAYRRDLIDGHVPL